MKTYAIRQAGESDLDRLVAMRLALQTLMERRNPSLWRLSEIGRAQARDKLTRLLQDADTLVLVAESMGGEAIGMVIGHVQQQVELWPEIAGFIDTLFVEEAWRRRGVGTALVARLCQFFAERNIEEVTLRYVIGNTEGEQFWTGLGFMPRLITAGTSRRALAARLARMTEE